MKRFVIRRRWLAGCGYFGCFAPFSYGLLIGWALLDPAIRRLRQMRYNRK